MMPALATISRIVIGGASLAVSLMLIAVSLVFAAFCMLGLLCDRCAGVAMSVTWATMWTGAPPKTAHSPPRLGADVEWRAVEDGLFPKKLRESALRSGGNANDVRNRWARLEL